eukprot:gene116-biopygen6783
MQMLRRSIGVSLRDKKRNDEIRKELEVCIIIAKARENRPRWFGHLQRADYRKPANDIMSIEVNGKRGRERPRMRWKDNIKRDMQELNLTGEYAEKRKQWKWRIRATNPDQSG